MKRLLFLVLGAYLVYIGLGVMVDYSIQSANILSNKTMMTIEKPSTMTNQVFVSLLGRISEEYDIDIIHSNIRLSNGRYERVYFVTQNNDGSLHTLSRQRQRELQNHGFLDVNTLLFGTISYYPLDALENSVLGQSNFYIHPADQEIWVTQLQKYDVITSITQEVQHDTFLITPASQLYPLLIVMITMIFFMINRRNVIAIKRLNGYRTDHMILDEVKHFLFRFGILFVVAVVFFFSIHTILLPNEYQLFFMFLIRYLWMIGLCITVMFVLVNASAIIKTSPVELKGKTLNQPFFKISFALKSVVVLMTVIYLSSSWSNFLAIYQTQQTMQSIKQKMEHYVQVPMNASATPLHDDDLQQTEQIKNSQIDFYNKTVDLFHGVLIHTSNYETFGDMIPAVQDGENNIIINEHYLDLNPVFDMTGEQITRDHLPNHPDVFHLLIPNSQKDELDSIQQQYVSWYEEDGLTKDLIYTVLYDDQKSEIYSFNSRLINEKNGQVGNPPPILEVFNQTYLSGMIPAFYGRSYFLKVESDDPYSVLYPYLQQANLHPWIIVTPLVTDDFLESIIQNRDFLIYSLIYLTIHVFALIAIVSYLAQLYYLNHRKRIAVMRMNGFSFWEIYKTHLWVQLSVNVVLLLIQLFWISTNLNIFGWVVLLEIGLFMVQAIKLESCKTLQVMKEGG